MSWCLGATALVANAGIAQVSGINVLKIAERVEDDLSSHDIIKVGETVYKEFSFKQEAYDKLKQALSKYAECLDKKPLLIFVDELDRVRPSYAIKFLEAIKHIFSVKGVYFILAVDRDQLESSIKQIYGNSIDFKNYYRRFITREANLPDTKNISMIPFVEALAQDFFYEKRNQGVQFPFNQQSQSSIVKDIADVCRSFSFVPREVEYFFRIFSQFMAIENKRDALQSWIFAAILLIAFSVKDSVFYHRLGRENVLPQEMYDFILGLEHGSESGRAFERMCLYASCAFLLKDENQREIGQLFSKYELDGRNIIPTDENIQGSIDRLARYKNSWGGVDTKSGFKVIYELLEEWRDFI